MTTHPSLLRKLLLAACILLFTDLVLAQLAGMISPFWDPIRTESRYRVPSDIYHHDLRKRVDTDGVWGEARYRVRTNSLEFSETFAGIAAESFAGRGVEVFNAAVVSYSPAIYYSKVRYLIEEVGLDLDAVVVFIDISDIADEAWFYEVASARWSTAMRLKRILRMRSVMGRLGVLLYDKFTGPEQAPPGATNLLRSMWTVQPSYFEGFGRRGLERAAANMERLHDLLAAGSVSLTVVVYPWPDQVLYGDRNSIQVSFWKRWCSRHGVQFIDLFPPFFGDDPPEERISRFFISNDTHLNERGHRLVAQHFLDRYR